MVGKIYEICSHFGSEWMEKKKYVVGSCWWWNAAVQKRCERDGLG